jgi:Fe-S-cluster containining protein
MSLEETIIQVEKFYTELDKDLAVFHSQSKLSCLSGCSACCHAPTIEATVLEMLPLAFHLYKENKAEDFYDSLIANKSSLCTLYKPLQTALRKGACADYPYRALVCRLFGSSFNRDKTGKPVMLLCKEIKNKQAEVYKTVSQEVQEGMMVPMASDYYMKLTNIDFYLTQHQYPINEAMRRALEMVMNHFHYTEVFGVDEKKVS